MNISITYSSSMRPICVEPYRRRMSRISIIGVHIDHLVNARPANQRCFSFDLERPTAKSLRSLFWADCITFIAVLRDGRYFCALQPHSDGHTGSPDFGSIPLALPCQSWVGLTIGTFEFEYPTGTRYNRWDRSRLTPSRHRGSTRSAVRLAN